MEAIEIGQRVRVTSPRLVHYKQVGIVVARDATGACYVHLDYDAEHPEARILFQVEDLELAPDAPHPPPHGIHWSAGVTADRDAPPAVQAPPPSGPQLERISTLLREQADRMTDEAAHLVERAGESRMAAADLDEQAGHLRERADRLSEQADRLNHQSERSVP